MALACTAVPAPKPARHATPPQRAAAVEPDQAQIEYRRGIALLGDGRPAEARVPLGRAAELSPDDAAYRIALAACFGMLGERARALEILRDVPRLSPTAHDADRALRLARALTDPFRGLTAEQRTMVEPALRELEHDEPGHALDFVETVLARFPLLAAGHLLAGLAAEHLGDTGRAVAELQRAAALEPDLPQPHAYLAQLYARDRLALAAEEYAEAVKRNGLDLGSLWKLGALELDRLRRPVRAAEALQRAAGIAPDNAALQALAARAELTAGSAAAARQRIDAAARRRAGDAPALFRLAVALYDERARARERERDVMTQCIDELLDAVALADPDNRSVQNLRRAIHGG